MTRSGRVLTSRPEASWLPPGGRADVVLAPDDSPPEPRCLVRLLVGYVRNTVPAAPPGYPWPSPVAHFAVWRAAPPARLPAGTWVPLHDPGDLVERHWWPLVDHDLTT